MSNFERLLKVLEQKAMDYDHIWRFGDRKKGKWVSLDDAKAFLVEVFREKVLVDREKASKLLQDIELGLVIDLDQIAIKLRKLLSASGVGETRFLTVGEAREKLKGESKT